VARHCYHLFGLQFLAKCMMNNKDGLFACQAFFLKEYPKNKLSQCVL